MKAHIRRCWAPTVAERAARQVAEHLEGCPVFQAAGEVALYAALPFELSTEPIARRAAEQGKALLWPRPRPDGGLDFVHARREELVKDCSGIPLPAFGKAAVPLGPGTLVVTPLLAFDARGHRLGRGGGAYDRALTRSGGAAALGVGFAFQRAERVPVEAHDVALEAVVTESGCRRSVQP